MTRYDLLKMNDPVLRIFIHNKINLKEVENIAIFEEYLDLRNRGEKFAYVVQHLSYKYGISPRSVSNIAKRMMCSVELTRQG